MSKANKNMTETDMIGHIINGFKRTIQEPLIIKKIISIKKMIKLAKRKKLI